MAGKRSRLPVLLQRWYRETVELNFLWQPYVEFVTPDSEIPELDVRMYYVCIEYENKFWFCSFFSYDKNFEEYRPKIIDYLYTLKPVASN